ncbi:MAG: 6-phosphofructokinase [Clostridia bacterium]|nr:6-phosphofructokinase [Clostridia bacterium]
MAIKKIGVLTSGGDAPGMNAAVRAVVRTALNRGLQVVGIYGGYDGLITGDIREMNLRSVANIINRGGTILGSARSPEFRTEEGMQKAIKQCLSHEIDGLVVIGGDGSFRGAQDMTRRGFPCIGIPGTIDNDISCCEHTIGYDTALNTCMELCDKLRDTMQSHGRCSVVEVMGRHAGYIALNVGIAIGATSILLPEIAFDFQKDVIDRMEEAKSTGKNDFIVVVAEGVGHAEEMAKQIQEITGIETRATILGHVQRGGTPTLFDRVLASRMGARAVELLIEGKSNRVVAEQVGRIVDFDIEQALSMKKTLDMDLYRMALEISM